MKWYLVPLLAIAAFALTYGLADALLADSQDAQGQVTAAGVPPAFTLLFSKSNDRSNPEGLDGKTVDGDIFVLTSPDDGVDDVDFFFDGVFERREKNPGFDFKGGSSLIGNVWHTTDEADGEHTIIAELLLLDGSTVEVSATFNVLNNAPPPTPTPTPAPQQREDQIVLFASNVTINAGIITYDGLGFSLPPLLALDPGDYPSGTTFQFEATWRAVSGSMSCLRIFDVTANTPVAGSEICTAAPGGELIRLRSPSIALAPSEHEYIVEGKCEGVLVPLCGSAPNVGVARIIAEWTE